MLEKPTSFAYAIYATCYAEFFMRAVIQRVSNAAVDVDGKTVGAIDKGYLILLGIKNTDTEKDVDYIAEKSVNLRIFADDQGKFDRSVLDIGGEILIVSQFTLYADCRKGRRPSFIDAAAPDKAKDLYEQTVSKFRA